VAIVAGLFEFDEQRPRDDELVRSGHGIMGTHEMGSAIPDSVDLLDREVTFRASGAWQAQRNWWCPNPLHGRDG
jgi:hypothetical protein